MPIHYAVADKIFFPTLAAGASTALSAGAGSAAYVSNPLLAIALSMLAAVAGVAAITQWHRRDLWNARVRGCMMLSAGFSIGLFVYLESPQANNWWAIVGSFFLGAFVNVLIPVVESEIPRAFRAVLGGMLERSGNPPRKDRDED